MEYLTTGLLFFILGNLVYLERTTATLSRDVKYLKDKLCGEWKGGKSK